MSPFCILHLYVCMMYFLNSCIYLGPDIYMSSASIQINTVLGYVIINCSFEWWSSFKLHNIRSRVTVWQESLAGRLFGEFTLFKRLVGRSLANE